MIRKKTILLLLVLIGLMVLVFGLYRQAVSKATPGRADDLSGTAVPQRIVSLSPNLTEIIFALGLGDRVAAVSNNCDWPIEAKAKPKVGTFWQPNTEVIIAAKPDLVVCETFLQQNETAQVLKRAGLNVLSLRVESIDELFAAIRSIGQTAGCSEKAEQLADGLKEQLDRIRESSSSLAKVKVLWVIQTEPVRVAGVNTFVNEIIELAGGQNAIAPTGDQYPSISTEEIIGCNAEVIIQSAMGTEDMAKQQGAAEKFWGRFVNLSAVKNKRIYVINPDTVLRLGPRVGQGVEAVAQCLRSKGEQEPLAK
ncbi:MAG: cobalamin-binding protein [Phycisphaerae bacterium]|nr:cobalamin-binding protein [Phycisphaerae bacterium]